MLGGGGCGSVLAGPLGEDVVFGEEDGWMDGWKEVGGGFSCFLCLGGRSRWLIDGWMDGYVCVGMGDGDG